MASNDAWQLGADIARGTVGQSKKSKQADDTSKPDAWQAGSAIAQAGMQKKRAKSTLKKAQTPKGGLSTAQQAVSALIPSYKHGGTVKKTGLAFVHRGEHITPAGKKTKIVASQVGHPVTHRSPAKKHNRRITKIVSSSAKK